MSATVRVTGSVAWTHIRETAQRHWRWTILALGLGAVFAIAGHFLAGALSVVVALVGLVVGTWVRGRTTTRVREVTHGGGRPDL